MRALRATMRAAFLEAWANRAGFFTQMLVMIVNDVAWVVFWALFFRRVGAIRGWETQQVLMLLAVLTTSAGFVLGFLSNCRAVGRMAVAGELDAALALPVPPLSYLLVRRVDTTNLGDVAFGVVLFAVAGAPSIERTAIFIVGVIASVVLTAGFLVAAGSIAFFVGRNDAGELGLHAILMFSSYPVDIFGGATKLLLYTVIPAAFVGSVPVRLVENFDAATAALLVGAAGAFALLGWVMFRAGLRRYTSGAVWTRA